MFRTLRYNPMFSKRSEFVFSAYICLARYMLSRASICLTVRPSVTVTRVGSAKKVQSRFAETGFAETHFAES